MNRSRLRVLALLCAPLLFAAACDSGADADAPDAQAPACVFGVCEPGWTVLHEGENGALLSVSPDTAGRLVAVGGPLGNADHDLVLYQGNEGSATPVSHADFTTASHWWVWNGPDGDARFVGEYGEVWRWTPGAAAPVQEAKDLTAETLFGIWGSSATDIWAVGGRPLMGGEKDVLLHSDGTRWERLTVPEPKGIAFYKVWGASADDVWVCGQGGWILRIRGGIVSPTFTWYRAQPGRLVFTISGNAAGEVWAVATPAGLYHYDAAADAFETVELPFPGGGLNGVSVAPGGDVWVVGSGGTKWQRKADGTWVDHTLEDPRGIDLHAVYATDDGAAVVGGHFNDPVHTGADRKGVLAVFNGRE
jgi:hypothetical protein